MCIFAIRFILDGIIFCAVSQKVVQFLSVSKAHTHLRPAGSSIGVGWVILDPNSRETLSGDRNRAQEPWLVKYALIGEIKDIGYPIVLR